MNTTLARRIVVEVTALAELCAAFSAHYGRHYQLKPGSPKEAWTLYQEILDRQRVIAGLLDTSALEQPRTAHIRWWEQQDAIDTSVTQELFMEAHQLVIRCVYAEAGAQDTSPGITCSQAIIAGLLHPNALRDPARNSYAA
jgi:hypothetical protein